MNNVYREKREKETFKYKSCPINIANGDIMGISTSETQTNQILLNPDTLGAYNVEVAIAEKVKDMIHNHNYRDAKFWQTAIDTLATKYKFTVYFEKELARQKKGI